MYASAKARMSSGWNRAAGIMLIYLILSIASRITFMFHILGVISG